MDNNPYASPAPYASFQPELATIVPNRPAAQWKRFVNLIIDWFATQILGGVGGFILGMVLVLGRANPAAPVTSAEESTLNVAAAILGILISLTYYLVMESIFQRTLGKLVTGTHVIAKDGAKPTFGQVLGRTCARMIPFEAFSFLGGAGFPVGWHDSLSKTQVVDVR